MNYLRRLLRRKVAAYRALLAPENVDAQIVLADLAKFCHADTSCWDEDARAHAVREGRREVWLRIKHHLKVDDATIDRMTADGSDERQDEFYE